MVTTHQYYWMKRLSINPQALLLLLFFCFFFIHHCDASRALSPSSVFYINPNNDHKKKTMRRDHFLGFFPRHFPVPASGPSRKHNDIGLQALLSP
ncbi:protein IDA-LIKE 4-like [Raphanus sativus]|uniref:Protein IDA-LIKE 4-like n=1 Tax=Raphanus sativus TaxID=3726 RepID=A0A6J0P3C1_RAPSA|nr:protein IDA-LIKE 4-like [Raphanus sativus]